MTKRRTSFQATDTDRTDRSEKRMKSTNSRPIDYEPCDWHEEVHITYNVSILVHEADPANKIIKKVLKVNTDLYGNEALPFEVQFVGLIPSCNRIVRPIAHSMNDPHPGYGTAIFEHYPLGDLAQWRETTIRTEDFDMVPEIHIWRFFLQIAQGLALIQNQIGPNCEERKVLLHRDIKPKNILVADNGSDHPSFRLHDFGCAKVWKKSVARQKSYSGTYEWQPPENPIINTKAADIWALGACVHFLANGKCPIESRSNYASTILAGGAGHPISTQNYKNPDRYYAARVPRCITPINLSPDEQRNLGYGPSIVNEHDIFNAQYSDTLNEWMERCLSVSPSKRPTAERLMNDMGPEARRMLTKLGGAKALIDMDIKIDGEG
ncbi:kinase-like domain-containing protein [Phaeosphaeria sp. MPI-PUGE-AT-0046c]|nr:kinase-like domain-containing protein [Phaeosphaeria sp. MPI-PUGE-AT-0046c]